MESQRSRKDACQHTIYIKGLCGICGVRIDPPQSTSVSMIHSVPELKVSEAYAKEIGEADQQRLIDERKLVLLVDLDQTILHTTHELVENDPLVHSFKLLPDHPTYFTKLRPHLREFLEEMSKIYELHIFTFGCRMYAHKIASIIDPGQRFFGTRILSRDESVDQFTKVGNLNNLFPCGDAMVCIIDDRADVWLDAGNLIQVKPYSYFKTSISDGAFARASGRKSREEEEDDESLDRDVDKLKALLGVDDNPSEDTSSSDGADSECGSSSSSSPGGAGGAEAREMRDNEEMAKGEEAEESKSGGENKRAKEANEPTESEADEGPDERRLVKRIKLREEAGQSDASCKQAKSEAAGADGPKQVEAAHVDPNLAGQPGPVEGLEKTEPSSSSHNEDPDDHLLKMQTILSRIHEKWYMELDEQRRFLEVGENYKLPNIKDIISRYLRKTYR